MSDNLKRILKIVVIVALVLVVAVLAIYFFTSHKTVQIDKMDATSVKFVDGYTDYLKRVDGDLSLSDFKQDLSSTVMDMSDLYKDGNAVGVLSLDILNTISDSSATTTAELKAELEKLLNSADDFFAGLGLKTDSSVSSEVVTIRSSSVCSKYGDDSEYCLDGTSKKLSANIYVKDKNSSNWVILLHGNTLSGKFMYQSMGSMYTENGYNIIAPDFRGQGDSDGKVAMGYLESLDSYDWIRYLNENYDVDNLVVHGVSLGGATTLQLATNPDFSDSLRKEYHVKGFVDDCGYTSMMNVIKGPLQMANISNLTSTLEKVGSSLQEFKDKLKVMLNDLQMPVSDTEISNFISGNISYDQLESTLQEKYPDYYQIAGQVVNSTSSSACSGLSYEECVKQSYQNIMNEMSKNNIDFSSSTWYQQLFPNIQKKETDDGLVDNLVKFLIMDLVDVGLTDDDFDIYQDSFAGNRNFQASDKVLIIHGQSDTTVLPSNSEVVLEKATAANTALHHYWKVESAPHAFIVVGMNKDKYTSLIDRYLECIENDVKCNFD